MEKKKGRRSFYFGQEIQVLRRTSLSGGFLYRTIQNVGKRDDKLTEVLKQDELFRFVERIKLTKHLQHHVCIGIQRRQERNMVLMTISLDH